MKVKGDKVYFEADDYKLAKELLDKHVVIHADGTGPFGEDEGAHVSGMDVDYADNIENYEGLEGKGWDELDDEEQSWFDGEDDFEQLNPYWADGIVCIDKDLGQSGINWCDWEMIFADLWIEKEDYDKVNKVHTVHYDMEVESTKRRRPGMLLSEAKEILKQNGYELVEVYDAVTDRNNVKNSRQNEQSYFTKLLKRIKNALEEEGVKARIINDSLRIGNWTIWVEDESSELAFVGPGDMVDADPGPESGEDASFRDNENDVTLTMYSGLKHVDTADFDVRNTPSMVQWILDHIER